MAEHWWRAYDDSIDHPKLLKLSDAMHRAWYTLQCIASANGGTLPPASDIALRLRTKTAKVAGWITHLVGAGLLDNDNGVFRPHNWDDRQYKTDKTDPTAPQRMQRYRQRKRNDRNATVTNKRPDTETEQNDVADDARARSLVSPEAIKLADDLLVIAGHELKFVPPGWCGAAMRVQSWLSQGWQPEIITAAVRGAAARKRGSPANSVQFFENAIAEEVARQAAPLPIVKVREAETLTVTHGTPKSGSLIAAIDRRLAELDTQAGANLALPENPVRLISG